jgi:pimeloyl-ACP methyl ester carboxylesterase
MSVLSHLPGITGRTVETPRGSFYLLQSGATEGSTEGAMEGQAVLFVHGNVSSATFWEETMLSLPEGYYALAPDLRGYGATDPQPVDATRGVRDFSDDLESILQALGVAHIHLVAHSMGGCVAMQYVIDHAEQVRSLTLVSTGSPYGFGGTKDIEGTPCWPDYAGSGGGLVNPELMKRLTDGDRSDSSDASPRRLLRTFYVKPPFQPPREDVLVEAMLLTATDEGNYSRDMVLSSNWPGIAPGTRGVNNALSPKYCNLSGLADVTPRPPVLWVRGADDQIVADGALSDPGRLGEVGILPGWPGAAIYPPQPMLAQIRAVLDRYQANGGTYQEHIIANTGHMPFMEAPGQFQCIWHPFLQK